MKKCIVLNVILLLGLVPLMASNTTGNPVVTTDGKLPHVNFMSDIKLPHQDNVTFTVDKTMKQEKLYDFPGLDAQITASVEELVNEVQVTADDMSDLTTIEETEEEKKAKQTIEAAKLGGTKIENFDDLLNMTLPAYRIQKIGNVEAIIVINSLRLDARPSDGLEPGGRLGIYIGIKIPQKNYDSQGRKKNVTLIFGTEKLAFTKEGGIQVGDIGLMNDVYFELGGSQKRSIVKLRKWDEGGNTGTFIKFGCDGVEEFGIGGDIYFTREWMLPADANGIPSAVETDRVRGGIQVVVQDWNNMLITTEIERFVLSKFQDVSFKLANCNIDLSDFVNAPSMKFPEGYEHEEGVPKELWRGVYIETFEVTFPKPFKKKCDGNYGNANNSSSQGCRMKMSAENLLIDPTGVSGALAISGQSPLASGALMNKKWSWSVDEVEVEIVQSKFQRFEFSGGIVMPIAKKDTPFAYTGEIGFVDEPDDGNDQTVEGQVAEYSLNVTLEDEVEFPVFKAFNVTLEENSQLNITVSDGEFKPSALLHGSMSVGKAGDQSEAMRVPTVKFANIGLNTTGPQFLTGGSVYLQGGGNKLNNFPIQISGIGISFAQHSVSLDFNLGIQLMKQSDGGLNASGDFKLIGKLETNVVGAHEWKFDRPEMSGFQVLIDLPAFKGCGNLNMFDEDPTYGKGFSANLSAHIMGKEGSVSGGDFNCNSEVTGAFSLDMAAVFGNAEGLRYFMVDGYVSSENLSIPLPPTPLSMTGFGGGVQYRMKLNGYHDPTTNSGSTALPIGVDNSGLIYKPDPNTLFGIKFAVGLATTGMEAAGGSPITGKLSCIIRFGSGLSLQNITFWGTAELVNPVAAGGIQVLPNVFDKIESLNLSEEQMHQQDMAEVKNAEDKIMAKVGLSLDFDGGFSFHGFAEVKIKAAGGKLNGLGQLDLLIDPNPSEDYSNGRWHMFVGGYENEQVKVPSFFNPENEITLYPVSVGIDYGGLKVSAKAYFLLGNDIPGPPGINPEAASFFGISQNSNGENRDLLYCGGSDPATGSGIAFGASLNVKFEKKIRKKIIFKKITILKIRVNGGAGFDIALLQYDNSTSCSNPDVPPGPHGLNGFRATGTIWGFVDVSGKVLGVRLPNMGVGLLLRGDIPNPSYFQAIAILKFIKKWKFDFDIGQECGHPCPVTLPDY